MLTLYQFPISHFCEKARWALDFKKLNYRIVNLVPGEHIKVIKSIARKTEVPVIQHDDKVIQGSSDIITYLDQVFPEYPLTPDNPSQKQQALDWETYVDENAGANIRLYSYHYLLNSPELLFPLLVHDQPWYKKFVFRFYFPMVCDKIKKYLHINEQTANAALDTILRVIDKLSSRLNSNHFLVGGQFTRADLAAASLLAPLRSPDKFGVKWPKQWPDGFQQTADKLKDDLSWIDNFYQTYR